METLEPEMLTPSVASTGRSQVVVATILEVLPGLSARHEVVP